MNWRRGLIRIWIVATALWVALIWLSVRPIEYFQQAYHPAIFNLGGNSVQFPAGVDIITVRNALTGFVKIQSSKTPRPAWSSDGTPEQIASWAIGDYEPASLWKALSLPIAMLFAPPLGLLLAGLILAWIARGFRASLSN